MRFNTKKYKEYLVTGGLTRDQIKKIRDDINISNQKSTRFLSYCFLCITIFISLLSVLTNSATINIVIECIFVFLSFVVYLLSYIDDKKFMQILPLIFEILGFAFGITRVIISPLEPIRAFIGLLCLMPLVFCHSPLHGNIIIFSSTILCIIIHAILGKGGDCYYDDFLYLIAFSLFSSLSNSLVSSIRLKSLLLTKEISYIAHIDPLTKLNNRQSFNEKIKSLEKSEAYSIVYIDVNGLHELNNSKGHSAGDVMLITISKIFTSEFGSNNVYRIGGDEFLVITENVSIDEIIIKINSCKKNANILEYHFAFGCSTSNQNLTPYEVLSDAEQKMYQDKKQFYISNHIDRRRRD